MKEPGESFPNQVVKVKIFTGKKGEKLLEEKWLYGSSGDRFVGFSQLINVFCTGTTGTSSRRPPLLRMATRQYKLALQLCLQKTSLGLIQ
jgi:hypothetical protein